MKNIKGFALLQALFFMMFIMAVISISMLMSSQRTISTDGARMATDAYPAVSAFLLYAQTNLTSENSTVTGSEYFSSYPLSTAYIKALTGEGFSDPTEGSNLSITMTQT